MDNHEKLSKEGQTEEIRDQGEVLLNNLTQSDAAQEARKDAKKSVTQSRYAKFQTIYDAVNRINRAGRRVFEKDPAKLVLFRSKWPVSTAAAKPVVNPPQ